MSCLNNSNSNNCQWWWLSFLCYLKFSFAVFCKKPLFENYYKTIRQLAIFLSSHHYFGAISFLPWTQKKTSHQTILQPPTTVDDSSPANANLLLRLITIIIRRWLRLRHTNRNHSRFIPVRAVAAAATAAAAVTLIIIITIIILTLTAAITVTLTAVNSSRNNSRRGHQHQQQQQRDKVQRQKVVWWRDEQWD